MLDKAYARRKECFVERVFISLGFILVHDGQHQPNKTALFPGQEQFPSKFFTRKYRLKMVGKFTNCSVIFKYDSRNGECIDFDIIGKEPNGWRGQQDMTLEKWKDKEQIARK